MTTPSGTIQFTTVIAVDRKHVQELRWTWPTWLRHRAEIMGQPLLILCDADYSLEEWEHQLAFVEHRERRLVAWQMNGVDQREKMLTALVHGVAQHVSTPWYLKLDTDTVAVAKGEWLQASWFNPDGVRRLPAFISQPWGYTKPANAIETLDDWGDTVDELRNCPRLNLPSQPGATCIRSSRIISWCFWGNTTWTREVAAYAPGRLPIPSQDTYLWYCAARRGDFYRRVSMKDFGWRHIHHSRNLAQVATSALQDIADADSMKRCV